MPAVLFEGPEGGGKSTHARRLYRELQPVMGDKVLYCPQPGATAVGAQIRALLLYDTRKCPLAELLLFLADRAQFINEVLCPALEAGCLVILDRFDLSSKAYQIAARGLSEELLPFIDLINQGFKPDLTFLLMVEPEVSMRRNRLHPEKNDVFERERIEFHRRVNAGFRRFAAELDNVHIIETDQPGYDGDEEAVYQEILAKVRVTLPAFSDIRA